MQKKTSLSLENRRKSSVERRDAKEKEEKATKREVAVRAVGKQSDSDIIPQGACMHACIQTHGQTDRHNLLVLYVHHSKKCASRSRDVG